MKTVMECIPCFVRQAAEAAEMSGCDGRRKERLLRRLLCAIADADWDTIPVKISQRIQRMIREETDAVDPYRGLKDRMNAIALDLLPALKNAVKQHRNPREALVRLAAAGNLLDAGSKARLAPEELAARMETVWNMPISGSSEGLFRAAEDARRILYLADNAGEIVFDRMLIEAFPAGKTTVAVRGNPVLNDATIEDAVAAGIHEVAAVIPNGSDAPGTLIEECSAEFRDCFDGADLIVSKGQGNYETLSDAGSRVFYLLAVKCPVIAADIGVPAGSLVVKRGRNQESGDMTGAGCVETGG